MEIKSAAYINLSDIATILGVEWNDLAELFENRYTWGDTDVTLVNIQSIIQVLENEEQEKVKNVLLSKNDPDLVSRLYVNLAD
jgi:hypothetical protein